MINISIHTLKGKKQSLEHIKKRVEARKQNGNYIGRMGEKNNFFGKPAWNKGKTGLQRHSEFTKQLMRLAKLGKKQKPEHIAKVVKTRLENAKKRGYYFSPEALQKISKINKGKTMSLEQRKKLSKAWSYEKHVTEQIKEKQRLARLNQVFPFKDTKPERMMQIALTLHSITFEKHKAIIGQPDIFIQPNICVFVDGDYWHKLPRALLRDAEVNHKLNLLGYQVIRIWESDIKNDANICAENIIRLIKETSYPIGRTI